MHPLSYTAPVPRFEYLAGRFLAAYALNALILLAVPAGMLLGMHWPDVEPEILGPWRPAAFVLAYLLIALPNAFIATAVQFAFAALGRRAIVSYFGSVVLFFASMGLAAFVCGRAAPAGPGATARSGRHDRHRQRPVRYLDDAPR